MKSWDRRQRPIAGAAAATNTWPSPASADEAFRLRCGKLSLPVVALYQRERAIASHHEAVRHKPKQKAGMTFSEVLDAVLIGLLRYLWGPTSLRKHLPKREGAAMKPADAERFEKLAEAYSTNADYCRHMAA